MNINSLTIKAQEALQSAVTLARDAGQQAVEPQHLLMALLKEDDSLSNFLLGRVGVNVRMLKSELQQAIDTLPKVSGGNGEQYFSTDTSKTIQRAVDFTKNFNDKYASVEHLLLGLVAERGAASDMLKRNGATEKDLIAAIREFRKGATVDSQTSSQEFNALGKYAINLNEMARSGRLDPVIGRDKEIERVIRVLSRKNKNNPCLIGEAGVGKTAIVEGLAERIAKGDVPPSLIDKTIISLDLTSIVAGAKYRGDFEERIKSIIAEVVKHKDIILFIDEIHRLSRNVEEILYPAMEDYSLDIIIGKGPSARSIRLDLPKFTLVGATTRAGQLAPPLRDRFGVLLKLELYTPEQLATIVTRSASILGIDITEQGAYEIASRSRGTPRIANRLLKRVRDYAQVRGDGEITLDIAVSALSMLEIDELGLDNTDRRMLETMIKFYDGKPVGLETLAATVGEEAITIEDVYEPYLMQIGFISRTPRGRQVTRLAYEHLGIPYKVQEKETAQISFED